MTVGDVQMGYNLQSGMGVEIEDRDRDGNQDQPMEQWAINESR